MHCKLLRIIAGCEQLEFC